MGHNLVIFSSFASLACAYFHHVLENSVVKYAQTVSHVIKASFSVQKQHKIATYCLNSLHVDAGTIHIPCHKRRYCSLLGP